MSLSADDIITALKARHRKNDREWAFFDELRVGTGYRYFDYEKGEYEPFNPEQRLDAYAINLFRSNNYERIAYEIKVSRSDFLSEINNPDKRRQALEFSNKFYFVTPKGLLTKDEIPKECGLIEVYEEKDRLTSRIKVSAPFRETDPPPMEFFLSIARRGSNAEGQLEWMRTSEQSK